MRTTASAHQQQHGPQHAHRIMLLTRAILKQAILCSAAPKMRAFYHLIHMLKNIMSFVFVIEKYFGK
jgi:hypothetical protein